MMNSDRNRIARNSAAFRSIQTTLQQGGLKPTENQPKTNSDVLRSPPNSRNQERNASPESSSTRFSRRQNPVENRSSNYSTSPKLNTRAESYYGESTKQSNTSSNSKGDIDGSRWSSRTSSQPYFRSQTFPQDTNPVSVVKEAYESCDAGDMTFDRAVEIVVGAGASLTDEADWGKIVDQHLFRTAIESGEIFIDLTTQICIRCIDHRSFQKAAFNALMKNLGELMMEQSQYTQAEGENLCKLMGKLIVSKWPRMFDSCRKETNQILYGILSAVYGWLDVLDNECQSVNKNAPSTKETEICAEALIYLTQTTGRQLWMKWPDLVDRIYSVVRQLIVTGFSTIQEETRYGLLDLYVALNAWPTKPKNTLANCGNVKRPIMVSKLTQTDDVAKNRPNGFIPDLAQLQMVSESLAQMRLVGNQNYS